MIYDSGSWIRERIALNGIGGSDRNNWGDLNMSCTDNSIMLMLNFWNLIIACVYIREHPCSQMTLAEVFRCKRA